jgi:hypothetical protein
LAAAAANRNLMLFKHNTRSEGIRAWSNWGRNRSECNMTNTATVLDDQ